MHILIDQMRLGKSVCLLALEKSPTWKFIVVIRAEVLSVRMADE